LRQKVNSAVQHPKFWLAYLALSVVALLVNGVTAAVGLLEPSALSRLFGVLFGLVGLWPLYGFVRQRRIDPLWLWKTMYLVTSAATLGLVAVCLFTALSASAIEPLAIGALALVLGGPYLFAMHQYVYTSPHLWH
jgi:hypothetical protein